mgnify:CR=1 FL=1
MHILKKLKKIWDKIDYPFLIHSNSKLYFNDITERKVVDLSNVKSGDVVAIIGDFDPQSILTLLHLIDKNVILVPLTTDTKQLGTASLRWQANIHDLNVDGTVTGIDTSDVTENTQTTTELGSEGRAVDIQVAADYQSKQGCSDVNS